MAVRSAWLLTCTRPRAGWCSNGLDTDKAEVSLVDGVLTLTIPKIAELKPTPIKVKTKARTKGTAKGKK